MILAPLRSLRLRGALPALILPVLLAVVPADAQNVDFRFGRPAGTLSLVGGWAMPGESSQLFREVRDQLTVDAGDFAAPAVMVEASVHLSDRFDVALAYEGASATVPSEMRDWVTLDDRPIPQTTDFERRRLMASLKAYLLPRGRAISEFAWVPKRWSPYIGGGVGLSWYAFYQQGDFVDFETLDIFESRIRSEGRDWGRHAMAGVDVSLGANFLLRAEYRHIWASAPLDPVAFEGFDDLDLSGGRATLGFAVRM